MTDTRIIAALDYLDDAEPAIHSANDLVNLKRLAARLHQLAEGCERRRMERLTELGIAKTAGTRPERAQTQPPSNSDDVLLDIGAVAARLGTSKDFLYRRLKDPATTRRLGARHLGAKWRFSGHALERFIAQG